MRVATLTGLTGFRHRPDGGEYGGAGQEPLSLRIIDNSPARG
jgi:hypothetical protein